MTKSGDTVEEKKESPPLPRIRAILGIEKYKQNAEMHLHLERCFRQKLLSCLVCLFGLKRKGGKGGGGILLLWAGKKECFLSLEIKCKFVLLHTG